MKRNLYIAAAFFGMLSLPSLAQEKITNKEGSNYEFTVVKNLDATPVQNQGRTGTCWSFSTLSYFESELMRQGKGEHVLSEMWIVRNTYFEKAVQYVRMHGTVNFGEGGAFHDVPHIIDKYGIVPEADYHDVPIGEGGTRNHSELETILKSTLDGIIKSKKLSKNWKKAVNGILDAYFGPKPTEFKVNGKKYTPKSFAKHLGFEGSDYVGVASFTHHPFYSSFVLEVPDNWAYGSVYNVPMNDLMSIIDDALMNGYSLAWASDVSEKGFAYRDGLALVPKKADIKTKGKDNKNFSDAGAKKEANIFNTPGEELEITQEMRQEAFDNFETTDDHGMHITGIVRDQNGKKYYIVKNSWGTAHNDCDGYFYASEAFVKYKTMDILIHKDALSKKMRKKLKL
jgi:bleomycin hydrolase